jgi:hypothetical protein
MLDMAKFGASPEMLNFNPRWRKAVIFMHWLVYYWGKRNQYILARCWTTVKLR